MFKEKAKGFIAGVCATVVVVTAFTVFAQTIDVEIGGIKVFWDGVEKTLTDATGKKVEPMIYEGTTYVPLRAMATLMGKPVDWDQQTTSVYVGEKPTAATTPLIDMKDKVIETKNAIGIYATIEDTDKELYLKNNKITGLTNVMLNGCSYPDIDVQTRSSITLALEGGYSKIVGKAVMPYQAIGSDQINNIAFFSVTNDGQEQEIASYDLKQTQDPIEFDVNLRGVTNLRIYIDKDNDYDCSGYVVLYDVAFLGK